MNEHLIQATANGLLGFMFLILAIENLVLYRTIKRRASVTRLGRAMTRKYLSWVGTGVSLMLLQLYSFYFNLTSNTGVFTFEVRNSLRVFAVVGMAVVVYSMWQMYKELRQAEYEINSSNMLDD